MEQEEKAWAGGSLGESQTAIRRRVSRSPGETCVVEGSEGHGIKEVTGPAGYCSDLQTLAVIAILLQGLARGTPPPGSPLDPHAGCDPTALWGFLSLSL